LRALQRCRTKEGKAAQIARKINTTESNNEKLFWVTGKKSLTAVGQEKRKIERQIWNAFWEMGEPALTGRSNVRRQQDDVNNKKGD